MRISLFVLVAFLLAACCEQVKPNVQEPVVEALAYFNGRDAMADANAAITEGDKRILAYYSRAGLVAPGVENAALKDVRLVDGMGDVIMNDAEIAMRQNFLAYAERYNSIVINAKLKK